MKKTYEHSAFLKYIVKPTYGRYLTKKFNITIKNMDLVNQAKEKTLILGNHSHSLDPIFVSVVFPFHIRWVAGSYLFKKPFTKFVIKNIADCISKSQGRSDLSTITEIRKALKKGSTVGLFPEGTRTWDGDFIPISLATAKLVKMLRTQVLLLNLESAYALHPRWATFKKGGPLVINAKRMITEEEVMNLSVEEIEKILLDNLAFSNDKWQEENQVPYFHKEGAVGINRLFYTCPKCNALGTIYGKDNEVHCSACKTKDDLDPYLRLKGSFGFTKLKEWNDFQRNKILTIQEFSKDDGDFLRIDINNKFKIVSKDFTSVLKNDGIVLSLANGTIYDFKFDDIKSLIISVQQTIEIVHGGQLYSFKLHTDSNALKYLQMFEEYTKGKQQ